MSYLCIKRVFDKEVINYTFDTIVQATDLKSKLEKLDRKKKHVTVASLDVINQYPFIKNDHIEKAILYFATPLTACDKEVVNACLSLIKFGMANTLTNFKGEYYEYGGSLDAAQRGLSIGRF